MKITKVETFALEQELSSSEQFAFSQALVKKRSVFICRIDTDAEITGWGEAFGPCRIHKSIVDNYYAPYLLGKNPLDIQVIWDNLYNLLRDSGQKGVTIQSLSAIDIALWDIKGKFSNQPIYQLMGGAFRDSLQPYATGMYRKYTSNEINETVAEALSYVERGFSGIKVKIGFNFSYDIQLVECIRKAVGENISIMVDANHGYSATEAIKVARALEDFDIVWFEEPVPPEDIDGYIEVRSKTNIPVAGGEAEFTRYGMSVLIKNRCIDILQPDCTITGGISEFLKIVTLCSIANIQCVPHVWGSGIALMVGIHAALSIPDFPLSLEAGSGLLEYDQTPNVFRENLVDGIPELKEGRLEKPICFGLGIEVNEDLLTQYSVGN